MDMNENVMEKEDETNGRRGIRRVLCIYIGSFHV